MQAIRIIFTLLLIAASSFSGESFINFSSCISIQDIEVTGDTVWVASSGGLYKHCNSTGKGVLLPNTSTFPDPYQTSFFYDSDKSIWSGTFQGYLARNSSSGKRAVSYSYVSAQWPITDIQGYGNYLIVGSSRGLSIFDKKKMNAARSATKFNKFSTSIVNSMYIFNKVLYVGLDQGVAKLNLSSGLESIKNFYDPQIWIMDTNSVKPVHSFLVISGAVKSFTGYSAIFKGNILHSDSTILYSNNNKVYEFPSDITVIKSNGKDCWIGTKENYFYHWDGAKATNFTIPGMTCANLNRVYIDHASNVWFIPRVNGAKNQWWRGIMSLQKGSWKLYNMYNNAAIEDFGTDPDFLGIAESRHPGENKNEWKMWFGSSGGGIKCFIPGLDQWSVYCEIQNKNTGKLPEFHHYNSWTKNDAIVQDSSGYIWISFYRNVKNDYRHHSLVCYDSRYEPDNNQTDPQKAHFRWFFEVNTPNHSNNYTVMTVDKQGNIIAGSDDGRVIVFNHNGNPLRDPDSVKVIRSFNSGINEFEGTEALGKVLDMVSTDDGVTRIVTQKGVYKFEADSENLKIEDEFGTGVKAIEAEDASILWLGVTNEGLVRYDLLKNERIVYGPAQGLISTNISDLALDSKNGILWVATESGVSRFSIGYRLSENPKSSILVYPNPFSKKRHSMIHFKNLPSGSNVTIHDMSGKLIANAIETRSSSSGSYYSWNPSAKTAPGAYFYSVQGENVNKAGKFIITP